MTAISAWGRIRVRFAGDSLAGLAADEARLKVPELGTGALEKMRRANLAASKALASVPDFWHRKFRDRIEAEAAEAYDEGRRYEANVGGDAFVASPEAKQMTKAMSALEADAAQCGGHAALVEAELSKRYAADPPRELVELKAKLELATEKVWAASNAFTECQRRYCATRSAKAYQDLESADRARDLAEKAAAALRLELYESFSLRAA